MPKSLNYVSPVTHLPSSPLVKEDSEKSKTKRALQRQVSVPQDFMPSFVKEDSAEDDSFFSDKWDSFWRSENR